MTFDTSKARTADNLLFARRHGGKGRLAYVFPSKLDRDHAEEVDHNLRIQRLNVGLSRGQEKIVSCTRKRQKVRLALRVALQHYRNELSARRACRRREDVDAARDGKKVLHWLGQYR